ncbi:MAG TPA: BMP family ABC transporter substrate-binding protein [Anaerolineales bacterium]|nr:BMP family ABC transporter substrate-binding protein [Anaerolineales bacterium]
MKKLFVLLMVVMLALSACTKDTPEVVPTDVPPTVEVAPVVEFKVGFVSDTGGVFDGSFNEAQWNGILQAQTELGVVPQFIQSDEATQYIPNLTEFATQGYNVIIASGFFLGADLATVAVQYPDINFAIFDYAYPDPSLPEGNPGQQGCVDNVMGIIFKTDQAAYLAGYVSAGMAVQLDPEDPALGYFGGAKIPSVTIFGVGFQHGMDAYNTAHGTNVRMIGWDNATGEGLFTLDFVDLVKGEQYARTLFEEGADVFMGVGGLIGSPGFAVAREYGGYGVWVDTDGYVSLDGVQDVILTSVLKYMQPVAFNFIKDAMEGNFQGCTNYVGDMATNGGVGMAPYHDLASVVPADLQAEVAALQAQIESGELVDTGCVSYPQWCAQGLYETP